MDLEKVKSFWERPEGVTGQIVGVGLAGLGLWGLYKALPTIITLLENTLYASFLGIGLFALVALVANPRIRNLVAYGFKSAMRAITRLFVTIDPVGIMQNFIAEQEESLREMSTQIRELAGQIKFLDREIDSNEKERTQALKMAQKAHEKGKRGAAKVNALQAGRLKESNVTYEGMRNKMEALLRILQRMHEAVAMVVADKKNEVRVKEREWKAMKAGYSAMAEARKILSGGTAADEMFTMAMDHVVEEMAMQAGEIEEFLDASHGFLETLDLRNGIYEEEALAELEAWEQKAETLLLTHEEKQVLLQTADDDAQVLDLDAVLESTKPGERFGGLFDQN